MKLLEQRRIGALFFAYLSTPGIGDNLDYGLKRYCPKGFGLNKLACSNDEIRWLFFEDEIVEAGRLLVEELWRNPRQANLLFDLFDKVQLLNQQFAMNTAKGRLSEVSTEQIVNTIEESLKLYGELWEIGPFAELIDFYLSKILKEELLRQRIPAKEIARIIAILSTPEEESFSRQAEKSVLKIAAEIEARKLSPSKTFSNPDIASMMQAHLADYYWVSCNYFSFSGLGLSNLKSLIKSALRKGKPASEKLFEFEKQLKDTLKERDKLMRKYSFDKKTLFFFHLLQNVALVYDNRKKSQMYSFYSVGRMLKELARRQKINSDFAKYLIPQEVRVFAKGKISSKELFERRKYCFVDYNSTTPKLLVGDQARKAEKELWAGKILSQDEVNGTCASPGKVIARARVINSSKNLSEVKKGEILVTGMTSPEYVPILGKVVGIITDDGGITCHAGIIAREFRLPCLVGTKVATKAIKTGDLLDLRAHHGLVRITERVEKTV